MPSSNIRDDLPNHYAKGWLLRQLAEVVLRSSSERRNSFAPRTSGVVTNQQPTPDVAKVSAVAEPPGVAEPKALPRNPSRTTTEARLNGENLRERLRRSQPKRSKG